MLWSAERSSIPPRSRLLVRSALGPVLVVAAVSAAWALTSSPSNAAPSLAREAPRTPGPAVIAAPTLGFVEDWPGTSLDGWVGGGGNPTLTLSNPGAGGVGGAQDGYLQIASSGDGHMGTRSAGAEVTGDWVAAGITRFGVWLKDVGAADDFEMHVVIGTSGNMWLYNAGFVPNTSAWQLFIVDLTQTANFTQIIGAGGTVTDVLHTVTNVLIRHDKAPYSQTPDDTHGDVGIDRVTLADADTPVERSTWGRLKSLYRSR